MIRVWLCVLAGLLLYALQDVMLWAEIFERHELWQFIGIYHAGWQVLLFALILAGFFWAGRDWRAGVLHAAMLYTLAHSGLEDLLYYALQQRPVPDRLPWLDQAPLILFSPVDRQNLVLSALIWVGAWLGVTAFLRKRSNSGAHKTQLAAFQSGPGTAD